MYIYRLADHHYVTGRHLIRTNMNLFMKSAKKQDWSGARNVLRQMIDLFVDVNEQTFRAVIALLKAIEDEKLRMEIASMEIIPIAGPMGYKSHEPPNTKSYVIFEPSDNRIPRRWKYKNKKI